MLIMKYFSATVQKALLFVLSVVALSVHAETNESSMISVGGMFVPFEKSTSIVNWRTTPQSKATEVFLPPPAPERQQQLQEKNAQRAHSLGQPLQIGIDRFVDAESTSKTQPIWQDVGDGKVARFNITSSGALALRAGLNVATLPDAAELRFSGSDDPDVILGVISGTQAKSLQGDSGVYWSPVTEGETQTIELFLPASVTPQALSFDIDIVSHLFVSPKGGFDLSKVQKDWQSCQSNVACSSLSSTIGKAVARMVFQSSGGSLCTGTLLNNSKQDKTPYFWTAAHCINSPSAASSLNTYWFYEYTTCGGGSWHPDRRQLIGGATLLYANNANDATLLRLNDPAPAGTWLSGWSLSQPSAGQTIYGIHHPRGTEKRISIGTSQGRRCYDESELFNFLPDPSGPAVNTSNLNLVSWTSGVTAPGSSGSGLFVQSGSDYYLVGGLYGGASDCSTLGMPYSSVVDDTYANADCYSDINLVYSSISQYLSPAGGAAVPVETPSEPNNPDEPEQPVTPDPEEPASPSSLEPSHNYRGMWYRTGEGGWGLTIDQYSYTNGRNPYLYVAWYTYDSNGEARWWLLQGDWTKKNSLTAEVRQYTGTPWGQTFNDANFEKIGIATITFTSAKAATFTYNVDGVQRTVTVNKSE
jgi:Secreted trypsin-like serine protease